VGLPETNNPERIYSMCLLLGERFTRPAAAAQAEGLRRTKLSDREAGDASELTVG
jgi:hypothetical protein